LRDIVFVFERNSHESGLKCDLLQDYRTIFRLPQSFATWRAPLQLYERTREWGLPDGLRGKLIPDRWCSLRCNPAAVNRTTGQVE
jgi:hypothetical protein